MTPFHKKKKNGSNHVRIAKIYITCSSLFDQTSKKTHVSVIHVKNGNLHMLITQMCIISFFSSQCVCCLSTLSKLHLKILFTCENTMLHRFLLFPHARRGNLNPVRERRTPPPLIINTNLQEGNYRKVSSKQQFKVKDGPAFQIHGSTWSSNKPGCVSTIHITVYLLYSEYLGLGLKNGSHKSF